MNRFFSILSVVMLAAACNGQNAAQKAPVTAPDRTGRHSGGLCPVWNDTFIGETTNRAMQLRMSTDTRGAMILEDVGVDRFVINGKGNPYSGHPGESYVGYCSSTTTTNGKPDMSGVGNITIEGYDGSSQLIFTITYKAITGGFTFSHVDGENQPLEPVENFLKKK